jgi:hypothetical protein
MPQRREVHPVMRGIGCILMVIVPVLSYGIAQLLVQNGIGAQIIPPAWYGYMTFPAYLTRLSGINLIIGILSGVRGLPAILTLTVVIMVVIGGILSVIFGYTYQIFGPPKYGPTDAPPPRVKVKRYKR